MKDYGNNSYFSDLYKEVNGFRPSSTNKFFSATEAEQTKMIDELIEESVKIAEQECSEMSDATKDFENEVKDFEDRFNFTRIEAIREILLNVHGIDEDDYQAPGYACYLLGLSFDYETEFAKVLGVN